MKHLPPHLIAAQALIELRKYEQYRWELRNRLKAKIAETGVSFNINICDHSGFLLKYKNRIGLITVLDIEAIFKADAEGQKELFTKLTGAQCGLSK